MKRGESKNKDQAGASKGSSALDTKMLSGYFDGELTPREEVRLQRLIEEDPSAVKSQLEAFREVRQEVRSWMHEQTLDAAGNPRELSIWEKIEDRLESQPSDSPSFTSGVFDKIKELTDSLHDSLFRPQLAGGLLAVSALAIVGTFYALSDDPSSSGQGVPTMMVAENTVSVPEQVAFFHEAPLVGTAADQTSQSSAPVVSMASNPPGSKDAFPTRRTLSHLGNRVAYLSLERSGVAPGLRRFFKRRVPLRKFIKQRGLRSPVPGGLRAGNVDIDWIKTDRPFRIVPARGRGAPPVIWMASRRPR